VVKNPGNGGMTDHPTGGLMLHQLQGMLQVRGAPSGDEVSELIVSEQAAWLQNSQVMSY